jgi:hypothetical protein
MAARAAIRSLLGNDAEINSLGWELAYIYSSNTVDTPPRNPWAVIHWDDRSKAFGSVGARFVTIWFYLPKEHIRDYGIIDLAILRTTELMTQAEQLAGGDGWILTEASWLQDSPDLVDQAFNAVTRWSRFKVACRPAVIP